MTAATALSFEQAAVRLAGGFVRPIDDESLREAIQAVLPVTDMGELESIKLLPGMVGAAADTLQKAWRAGIELGARAAEHPRLDAIARLEAAVLAALPDAMMRPADIVAAATTRVAHAPSVLGPVEIDGLTELSPCWRPLLALLALLARQVPVRWSAGPRSVPDWIDDAVSVSGAPAASPRTSVVSAATAYHEAVEAMRWARSLLASGIPPADIAIATTSPAGYEDHFMTLRSDANIDLHFVHGIRTVTTRDGQAAAALADILVRGISQTRIRRMASLCGESAPLASLPEGWLCVLPTDAPLSTTGAWNRLLVRFSASDWPDGVDHTQELRDAVTLLNRGTAEAADIGAAFLTGRALAIWRKALIAGSARSIDITLETLKPATIEHYRAQVRAYLAMTGAERGLIVMMTTGQVIEVVPTPVTMPA